MEEALQPLEADEDQQSGSTWHFAKWVAASLFLHLVCAVILLSLPQGPGAGPSVTYIDLGSIKTPPPMTAPVKEPAAIPEPVAAQPELPAVPETPAAPEPAPEQAAQQLEQPAAPQPELKEDLPLHTLGIGLTKGFFRGLGDGETLRDDIKDYYIVMLEKINEKWWLDPQLEKRLSSIVVNITVARNGEILDSMVIASSGDRRYDKAVLTALAAANPLPPLPDSYTREIFQAPIRLVPPLNLMAW